MEVESSICLSDLVPALRWSRPQQVAEVLGDPRLPAGWWSSLALSKALGTAGLDWICERLARLAASRWDHLPLIDLIPALTVHQVDPALPGWPEATRTAVTGLGGWQRLRRLSPSDLSTPSATPEVVIGSIFREILGRIPAQRQAAKPDHPEVTRPLQRGAAAQDEARGTAPEPQTGSFAAQSGSLAERPEGSTQQPQTAGPFAAAHGNGMPQRQGGAFPGQERQPGSFPATEGTPPRPAGQPSDGAPARQTGSFPAQQDSGPQSQTGSFPAQQDSGPQPQTGSFPAQSGASPAQPQGGLPQRPGQSERLPQHPGGPQPGRQDTGSLPRIPAPGASGPGGPSTGSFPAIPAGPSTGSFPAIPAGPSTGSFPAIPAGPSTGSFPAIAAGDAPKGAPPRTPAYPAPATGSPSPVPSDTDHAMVRVVDSLFRSLDKLELAVAVHRLFAEDPVSLRTLAHKMLVERDALSQAQRTAEERVLRWLRSSESAPVTGHMFRLTEWLGAAATEDQLIGADPAHPVMVPSLRTPLWRVLVTLMPDRRLQDGWLVVGDIHRLQARTRQLLASSTPDADVVELMAELGIRAHSAKAWLDALPPETAPDQVSSSAPSPAQPLPRRTPGANGHHHRGGQPIPPATTASIDPSAALATLSALSGGRSGMLPVAGAPSTPPAPLPSPSSDPRRWQRIEVTPEHLRGGPVPVPEGYAAQLGMRPGTLLSVTGPGDNAIVLVWQGHQPVFDSLQPVLMRLNARPGDQVYVTVDGYRLEAQLTA
ncbi:hypothetical protein ACQEVF_36465 [Nonomuraea polychroma]|uniref:hypothetical protein n=1 Tax=Nonomuraea polychroma TaxID=46176 RepID=UPI003D924737